MGNQGKEVEGILTMSIMGMINIKVFSQKFVSLLKLKQFYENFEQVILVF